MSNDTTQEIPYGYCHCGCGQKTPIAKKTYAAKGHIKGQPTRYIIGHKPAPKSRNEIAEFWARVDKRGPDDCWCFAILDIRGYGCFNVNGISYRAHRFSYELHKGAIPEGLHVCHECDNRACVNPNHLWPGTDADNHQDMVNKGRDRQAPQPGEVNAQSKLTADDVRTIRAQYSNGIGQQQLAKDFGVNHATISVIVLRQRWKHIE